jgi:inner membrane protein
MPLAFALFGFVLVVDFAWIFFSGSTAPTEFGLVDEPAHIATCLLLMLALAVVARFRPALAFAAAALVASVAIDLDHLPQYLGWDVLSGDGPRPYPHCLLTVALIVALASFAPARLQPILLGAAFGVAAHLFRDLATGPGVALFWPLSDAVVELPYAAFAAGLALAVALTAAPFLLARADAPPAALPFRRMRAGGSYPARGARG